MKGIKFWVLFGLILCYYIGFSQERINTYFNNVKTIKLKSIKVEIKNEKEIFFTDVIYLDYIDNLLILSDDDPNFTMKILNLETGYLRKFGRKGRGPNELQKRFSRFSVDYTSNKLYISDFPNFYVYSIDDLKKGIDDIPISKFNLPSDKGSSFLSSTYSNGKIIGNTYEYPLEIYNINTKSGFGKFEYNNGGALVNQSGFYSHPIEDKIAYLETFSDKMGIYSIKGNNVKLKELPWDYKSKVKTKTVGKKTYAKQSKLGFINGTTSEKYIFTLYSGKQYSDSESFFLGNLTDVVYVFDWETRPIKKYKLDKEVRAISYDKKNNVIYASCYDELGTPYIAKFELDDNN